MPLDAIADRLAPQIADFGQRHGGPLHFVGHSMGGLVIRCLIARHRPARLGRVVMLGTRNGGSEVADLLYRHAVVRPVLGKAAAALVTRRDAAITDLLPPVDYPLGIIAGSRPLFAGPLNRSVPLPHDGKVSVAATYVEGETDHLTLPVSHTALLIDPRALGAVRAFLAERHFPTAWQRQEPGRTP